jgi:PAS domain S-box-containing protein
VIPEKARISRSLRLVALETKLPRKKTRAVKPRTKRRASDTAAFVDRFRGYEQVVESLEEMIVVVDRDYRYVTASQAYLDYRGVPREQILGRRASDVLSPDLFEKMIQPKLDECFQNRVVKFELKYQSSRLGHRETSSFRTFPSSGPRESSASLPSLRTSANANARAS